MNKRNTLIASIILVALVVLLFAKGCVFHASTFENVVIESKEQAVCKKDFNPPMYSDSTTIEKCNYPIVFHYQKPKQFGNVRTLNHIVGLTMSTLDSCPPMPDSTQAIHVYIKSMNSKNKFIYLGVYSKTSMNEDVEYRLTYPVNDAARFYVATDSGMLTSVMHWKQYEVATPGKFKEQAEERMTKQVEDNLIRDILKKMHRNENSK